MEGDVCSYIGDLISGPKHNPMSVYGQELGALLPLTVESILSSMWQSGICVGHLWTQERETQQRVLCLLSRSRHSSTTSGLAFIFHLTETENWGEGCLNSSLRCCLERPLCRRVVLTLQHRVSSRRSDSALGWFCIKFCQRVLSFCMYYCLFIKGFEVLSQW